jgi:hypothetical protein
MHILVVEALLVAIYLTEKKDVYIHIRPTQCSQQDGHLAGLSGQARPAGSLSRPTWPVWRTPRPNVV